MHFSNFLGAIVLFITFLGTTSALALPAWPRLTYPKFHLRKRGLPGAVYICTDSNFLGQCGWVMPSGTCHIPGTGTMAPESIGPDPNGFCVLYGNNKCTGNQIQTLRFPGVGSGLPEFQSLKCFPDTSTANNTVFSSGGISGGAAAKSGDPRLAGGKGSLKAKKLNDMLGEMDRREGMIGLEKSVYY